MPLFDEIQRTETRPKRQNEDIFDYLNFSARPMAEAIRELFDNWFVHLPTDAMADLRARFRKRDLVQHQSAFFELYLHEFLLCCGYEVEVHPTLDGLTTCPDFLASKSASPCLYLEATLAMPPTDLAADRRLAEFHDSLNRVSSPDYFLDMKYRGSPEGNLKGRQLRGQLEDWLRSLNFEEIRKVYDDGFFDSMPMYLYEEGGLSVTFTPIPKGPANRGRLDVRTIGTDGPMEAKSVHVHDDIKSALGGKAKKYGEPALPLVVAVNVMNDFCEEIDIMNALFGEEQITVYESPDGELHHKQGPRKHNGIWFGPQGPRNQTISAALITSQLLPWTLRSQRIDFVHNPWARCPLEISALPIPQRTVSLTGGALNHVAGTTPAEILGIPMPWPVPD